MQERASEQIASIDAITWPYIFTALFAMFVSKKIGDRYMIEDPASWDFSKLSGNIVIIFLSFLMVVVNSIGLGFIIGNDIQPFTNLKHINIYEAIVTGVVVGAVQIFVLSAGEWIKYYCFVWYCQHEPISVAIEVVFNILVVLLGGILLFYAAALIIAF